MWQLKSTKHIPTCPLDSALIDYRWILSIVLAVLEVASSSPFHGAFTFLVLSMLCCSDEFGDDCYKSPFLSITILNMTALIVLFN